MTLKSVLTNSPHRHAPLRLEKLNSYAPGGLLFVRALKLNQMKEEDIKGSAVDWFAEVYQADYISMFGGYFGDYRIYDDKLIIAINGDEGPNSIEMFEISAIIKLYKKYKKYTDDYYGCVQFKREYDWEKDQFFEEINQV